jgi:hypothetical protein
MNFLQRIPRRVAAAALAFMALSGVSGAGAFAQQSPGWLLGRWELAFDPDGSTKDFLEFHKGGEVVNISSQGRHTQGMYGVQDEGVRASFVLPNGKTLPLLLVPTADRRQLKLRSSRTGNTAVYEKVQ